MKRNVHTKGEAMPHRYRLVPGLGYAKALAVKRGIRHRTVGGYLFTDKPL